jgi:hypothetical protein
VSLSAPALKRGRRKTCGQWDFGFLSEESYYKLDFCTAAAKSELMTEAPDKPPKSCSKA